MDVWEEYKRKLKTPAEIASEIADGSHIYVDCAWQHPAGILKEVGIRGCTGRVRGLKINMILDVLPFAWYTSNLLPAIKGVSWFSGHAARKAVNGGYADVMPCHYSEMASLMHECADTDVYCAAVSPMDKHGYFSLGPNGSVSDTLIGQARNIYLEVNEKLPRTLHSPIIHISQATAVCEYTADLPVAQRASLDETSRAIGELIAQEVPDGAVIQLGIGAIPDAVGSMLADKQHLGIHSELFTDSMVDLIEEGVVDNSRKERFKGRSVAAFAFGSQRMLDFIDENPSVMFLPSAYVNDSVRIAAYENMISVNTALSVDFYGQVCAESLGSRHISGTGGQADFVRGATHAKNGKSFIALPSTAKGGTVSRILPMLQEGSIVTTSKNDVDRVVTEYGIALLRGRTLSQRTKALISIAHPKFRDELTFAAKKLNILI